MNEGFEAGIKIMTCEILFHWTEWKILQVSCKKATGLIEKTSTSLNDEEPFSFSTRFTVEDVHSQNVNDC